VTVTFQLPCLKANYANKPEHYLSHLIGHEGPGSLLSALKVTGGGVEEEGRRRLVIWLLVVIQSMEAS